MWMQVGAMEQRERGRVVRWNEAQSATVVKTWNVEAKDVAESQACEGQDGACEIDEWLRQDGRERLSTLTL